MPLRRKRKSKTIAPATVLYTAAKNPQGVRQLCVYGECQYGGTTAGPVWGHTKAAVDRCLCALTAKCDCGRSYHKHKYTEGQKVRQKEKPA